MNNQKILELIKQYKKNFQHIHLEEIYKWRAIRNFQNHWDIDAPNFHKMLETALGSTQNLLASVQYFPRGMILEICEDLPDFVRNLFRDLYNEEEDLVKRIEDFQEKFHTKRKEWRPELRNDYQDARAILVYLCLRFPDSYYLYKFNMFKSFASLIDYPYIPTMGAIENIPQYLTMCDLLKDVIIRDDTLVELHRTRIKESEYNDKSFNVLTQDLIYAGSKHSEWFTGAPILKPSQDRLIYASKSISSKKESVEIKKGTFFHTLEVEKEKKIIGDLGELLVMQYEKDRVKRLGIHKEPEHIAKSKGDGLGFDILSYNEKGEELLIEVKTTTSNSKAPFYLTKNEVECSKINTGNFVLYRLFEYSRLTNSAKFYKIEGDLARYCVNPILFKIIPD